MKIGIVGSRTRNMPADKQILKESLEHLLKKNIPIKLVSGGCVYGADQFAYELAKELQLEITIHYPDKTIKSYAHACLERNTLIAQDSDMLLAVWDNKSKGTYDTIKKVRQLKKPVIIL